MALSRSEQMARIRSEDTSPEVTLRRLLSEAGVRHRRGTRALPGKPDLVYVRRRVVVFVDGCFWHGCPEHYVPPRSSGSYWAEKLQRNVARDLSQTRTLMLAGWRVVRIWEHEVEETPRRALAKVLTALRSESWRAPQYWRVVRVEPVEGAPELERRRLCSRTQKERVEVTSRSFHGRRRIRLPESAR